MTTPEPEQVLSIYYWLAYLVPLVVVALIVRAYRQDKDDKKD